jgi:hypothetical protein
MPLMAGNNPTTFNTTPTKLRRSRNTIRLRDRIDPATRNRIAVNTTMQVLGRAGNKLSKLAVTLDILWLHEVGSELNNLAHEISQRYSAVDAAITGNALDGDPEPRRWRE